jgi:hypothetical protein
MDTSVPIREGTFWLGLFIADRGLAEVLPSNIARGWIHFVVGTIAILYGLGLLSEPSVTWQNRLIGAALASVLIVGFAFASRLLSRHGPRRGIWKRNASSDVVTDIIEERNRFRRQYLSPYEVKVCFTHLDDYQLIFELDYLVWCTGYRLKAIKGHIFYKVLDASVSTFDRRDASGLGSSPIIDPDQERFLPNGGAYAITLHQPISHSVVSDLRSAVSDERCQIQFFIDDLELSVVPPDDLGRGGEEMLTKFYGVVYRCGFHCERIPWPDQATLPMTKPRDEIRFDYLPDSPMNHGWKQGYSSNPIPADATWKAATDFPGGMSMALSDLGCAIDYTIGRSAVLSKRIVCDFKFSNTAMIWVRVKLATRDNSKTEQGFIKFLLGSGQPVFVPRYKEWELPIDPPSLGSGWHHLDIDLIDAVNRTWGQNGWQLSELVTIRVRGDLSISPIKLY